MSQPKFLVKTVEAIGQSHKKKKKWNKQTQVYICHFFIRSLSLSWGK